ncbi:SDR family oxidoreductase [Paraburkholderia sp. LEh10]|nr:SDR family oxidoreductase [Paraburkholderia sp. LEh10]
MTEVSSAIGFSIAHACLMHGHNVVGSALTPERMRVSARLGHPGQFAFVVGDIAKPAATRTLFDTAIERFGRVDVLINNLSGVVAKPLADYSNEDLEYMVAAPLRGFVYLSRHAARYMSARRCGHIVSVTASVAMQGREQVTTQLPSLLAGGVDHATRALAADLAPCNVMVNLIAPETFISRQTTGTAGTTPDLTIQRIVDVVLHVAGLADALSR